jgi:hypothetical protein
MDKKTFITFKIRGWQELAASALLSASGEQKEIFERYLSFDPEVLADQVVKFEDMKMSSESTSSWFEERWNKAKALEEQFGASFTGSNPGFPLLL